VKNDPKQALQIVRRELAKPNPGELDGQLHLSLAVYDICYEMFKKGINTISLTEDEWIAEFRRHGADQDEAVALLESVASWGVNDEL